jgi:hypothetical protein
MSASIDFGPFINLAPHPPCECGEEIHLAFPGGRPGYAAVLCFEGHFQGWVEWPECGPELDS